MTLTSILLLLLQDHKKKKWHSRIEKKFSHIRYVAPSLTLRRSVMHTGQLFPAVCFWKNLIPDAVKYWFSLTSVKALIFLLRLNNLSNKIFLPFWASINDLTRTPSFHIAVSSSMPSSCPQPMAVVAVIPNRLSLVSFPRFHYGATMMIMEIDSPTFPVITFIIRGKSRKMKVSQSPLEESGKRPGLRERDSSKFSALQEKIPHRGNVRLHCL